MERLGAILVKGDREMKRLFAAAILTGFLGAAFAHGEKSHGAKSVRAISKPEWWAKSS